MPQAHQPTNGLGQLCIALLRVVFLQALQQPLWPAVACSVVSLFAGHAKGKATDGAERHAAGLLPNDGRRAGRSWTVHHIWRESEDTVHHHHHHVALKNSFATIDCDRRPRRSILPGLAVNKFNAFFFFKV